MSKKGCGLLLLALLGLGLIPAAASAQQCAPEGPQFVLYWDIDGTERVTNCDFVGEIKTVYIFGEGFECAFASAVQFKIDYGPCLTWLGDFGFPAATLGNSNDGVATGFGVFPRPCNKFLVGRAFVACQCACDGTNVNVAAGTVVDHPLLGPPKALRFPDDAELPADPGRSQLCQFVELDIKPGGSCPPPLNVKLWLDPEGVADKGGVIKVAVLGDPSTGVDPFFIDASSCKLGGATANPGWELADVSTAKGSTGCDGGKGKKDGVLDLLLEFRASDVIAGLPIPNPGDLVDLTLTGCYIDGLPFSATDEVKVVGNIPNKFEPIGDSDDGALSFPNPNPFNPVTRITYLVPQTQHVRLAIFDVSGRLVDELVNEVKGAGEYVVEWDAGTLPSGVYFYRLETGGKTLVKRATLLK